MILLIYNEKICREILLPQVFDTDWPVELDGSFYQLRSDVKLRIENRYGEWFIRSDGSYFIMSKGHGVSELKFSDGTVIEVKTVRGDSFFIVASEEETSLRVMKKYDISRLDKIRVGSGEGNTIQYRFNNLVSGYHLRIYKDHKGWIAEDLSTNGTFCDSRRFKNGRRIRFGDHITIYGLHIVIMGNVMAIGVNFGDLTTGNILEELELKSEISPQDDSSLSRREHPVDFFNRSPRSITPLFNEKIKIEAPPQPKRDNQKPTFLVIGPAFTMAIPMVIGCMMMVFASSLSKRAGGFGTSPFIFMGLTIAVGAGIVGAFWAVMNLRYNKELTIAEEEKRFNAYSRYLMDIVERLRAFYTHNRDTLLQRYPSASECSTYDSRNPSLWNRSSEHYDFLYLRLGLGDEDFQIDIEVPEERFSVIHDSLQARPRQIKEEFRRLTGVPAGINLKNHTVTGIVGGIGKKGAYDLMNMMVAGITAAHAYTDVKTVFLYDDTDREHLAMWENMKWLPHVWSEDRSVRFMAGTRYERSEILYHLANIIRTRAESTQSQSQNNETPIPYYIIFVSDPKLLEGELISRYIYSGAKEYGISTVILTETLAQLPGNCDTVIENDPDFQGIVDLRGQQEITRIPVRFDRVDPSIMIPYEKRIANIRLREITENSEIPTSLGFLEMFGVQRVSDLSVEERWRKNRTYQSISALIGKKAGGKNCYLDIHEREHGPHGLVAGTTGSGKSETLQTYILSLAVNFSPDDVSFFVIDYKGGGMANLFSDLPHMAGQISNLSGSQVRRAMISIKSELLRRQRLFAETGVNNINKYTMLYKEHRAFDPAPHLFIIIDEFAELKQEEPEFMRELISVSRTGRSLGIHLILATQKPSGTVDDDIRANSNFHLCLRVKDRQDSMDMLQRPDAAYLTLPGRGYLQVRSGEIYDLFQSGYSGAVYTGRAKTETIASMIGRTGKMDLPAALVSSRAEYDHEAKSELDVVIDHLKTVMELENYEPSGRLWLPELEEKILLQGTVDDWKQTWKKPDSSKKEIAAVVGRYDDPENQSQGDLRVSFTEGGHLAVCGNILSGKSTFMQTLIYSLITKFTPEELQLYLLDFSGQMLLAYEEAPHVGGIVTERDSEKISKFFVMLEGIVEQRKKILQGGNYDQYLQSGAKDLPAIVIVIDNYALFRERTNDKFDTSLIGIMREGAGYGIYLAISSAGFGMSEIPSRIGDHIGTVISLEQQDKFKYMEILRTSRLQILPEPGIRGRGLAYVGERILEFQTCLSVEADDDFERGQKLKDISCKMASSWRGALPVRIPEIPENPVMEDLAALPGYSEAMEKKDLLPIGFDSVDASVYSIDLKYHYCFAVTGRKRTGKTSILRALIHSAHRKGVQIAVLEKKDKETSVLEREAASIGAEYAGTDKDVFDYFKRLTPEFARRNKIKQDLIQKGRTDEEIYEVMSVEPPLFIFIDDLASFVHMAYKPEGNVGAMSGFLENIWEKGSAHGIWFFASLDVEDEAQMAAYRAYNHFVSGRRGIHAGGNLQGQKLFHLQNIPYAEQVKVMKKGLVYITSNEDENTGKEIVIPMVRSTKEQTDAE